MIQLNRRMLELVSNSLQIGSESPNYSVRVKRIEENSVEPYEWKGDPKGAISLEISGSTDSGSSNATVQIEDTSGLMSPEVLQPNDWSLIIKPSTITIQPGETTQFCAYVISAFENVKVGGDEVSNKNSCVWKLNPVDGDPISTTYGDISSFKIGNNAAGEINGNLYNSTISGGGNTSRCIVTVTYKGITASSRLIVSSDPSVISSSEPIAPIIPNQESGNTNVYGNVTDIEGAKMYFGDAGFTYILTDEESYSQVLLTSNDIAVGASTSSGGVSDTWIGDGIRLGGVNASDTRSIVQSYNNLHHKYTIESDPIVQFVTEDKSSYFNFIDDQLNVDYSRSHYKDLLNPENYIQLSLGYGDVVIPVLTGAIDSINVSSKDSTITLTARDNMRYLLDQTIDALKHGQSLTYPRQDITVTGVIESIDTVNKSKFVQTIDSNTVSIRSGPSDNESVIGQLNEEDSLAYIGTTNNWNGVMYGSSLGYVYGPEVKVVSSESIGIGTTSVNSSQNMIKINSGLTNETIYQSATTQSTHIGTVRENETYPYLRTDGDFYNIDYNGMSGYIETSKSSQTTINMDGWSNEAKYEAIGLEDPFYLKTSASEASGNTSVRVYNGDILTIVSIEDDYRKVKMPFGDTTEGYINASNVKLVYVPKAVDSTTTQKIEWKATDIVMDLAIEATTIKGFAKNPKLDRTICNVIVEDYYAILGDNQLSPYTITSKTFPITETYYDACMEVVNLMGAMHFKCTRFGDLKLSQTIRHNRFDMPDWIITDYVDLTSLSYKKDSVDQRNRVIIMSSAGWSMYEHTAITQDVTKGVNRTTSIQATFADTEAKRRIVAANFFEQVVNHYKSISIAIKGNPLIDVYNVISVKDLVSGVNNLFSVTGYKHSFNSSGFLTQLDLIYISTVDPTDLTLLTEEFPTSRDVFNYRQYLTAFENKEIVFKYPVVFTKVKLRVSKNDTFISEILIEQDIAAHNVITSNKDQYVVLKANNVYVRLTPDGEVKKIENYGFYGVYIGTTGSWYNMRDKDGQGVYVWASYCAIQDSGTSFSTTTSYGEDAQVSSGNYPYSSLIVKYSELNGLPTKLIASVIQAESSFRNLTENSSHAAGLMQLIPGTATEMGCTDRMDPEQNIKAGCKYLKKMIDNWDGNIQLGLASYNAGADSVHRWSSLNNGSVDWNVLRNSAYSETKNYVDKIMGWYNGSAFLSSATVSTSTEGLDGTLVENIISLLKSKLGCQYVYGGNGPGIFDCSGLVQFCYGFFNVTVPRTTDEQYKATVRVERDNLVAGDLCFRINGARVDHVGVYIGDGKIIQAPQTGDVVKITDISSYWNGFGRVPSLNGTTTYHGSSTTSTSATTTTILPVTSTDTVTHIENHYKITTTQLLSNVTQSEYDKANNLNGKALCAIEGCVLYNVGIISDGALDNQFKVYWSSTNSTPVTLDLTYDIMIY